MVVLAGHLCYLEVTHRVTEDTRLRFVPMQTERLPRDHTDPERYPFVNLVAAATIVSTSTGIAASAASGARGLQLSQVPSSGTAPYTFAIVPPESRSA